MGIETQDQLPQVQCIMRPVIGLLAVALVAVMSTQAAHALTYTNGSKSPCRDALEQYLINRGITEAEVRSIAIHPHFVNLRNDVELVGYDTAVRLVGKKKSLRIRMNCDCQIASRYSRRPC